MKKRPSSPSPAAVYRHSLPSRGILRSFLERKLSHLLGKLARQHLAAGHPQPVVFAFDHIAQHINIHGVYEGDYLDTLFTWLHRNGITTSNATALDLGANIGNHSLYFARHFAHVHSFEPNPRTFKVLSLNAELANNITCHNLGVSDHTGTTTLQVNPSNIGGSAIAEGKTTKKGKALIPVTIKLTTVDAALPKLENLKLIKIDVEGHELPALTGAAKTIKKHMPIIMFEQHESDFKNGSSPTISLLQSYGYTRFATVTRHPVKARNIWGRLTSTIPQTLLKGSYMAVELTESFPPGFYNFIVALPDWFPTNHPHR